MELRDLRAFGHAWDIVVERDGEGQKVTVSSNGQTVMSGSGPAGKSHAGTFAKPAAPGAPRWFQLYHFRDRGVTQALLDEAWPVRAQAAASLSALGDRASVPALSAAIEDESWWVRRNLADAPGGLGEPGPQALLPSRTTRDPYLPGPSPGRAGNTRASAR